MLAERPRGWLHDKRSGEAPAAPTAGPTDPRGTLRTGGRSMADQVERIATTADARGGRARRLAGAVAPAVAHAHRHESCARCSPSWRWAAPPGLPPSPCGRAPSRWDSRRPTASPAPWRPSSWRRPPPPLPRPSSMRTWRWPWAGTGPATWSRIMAAACAALLVACPATVLDARLWPGIAALVLVAALGYLFGFRRWQPRSLVDDRPARRRSCCCCSTKRAGRHNPRARAFRRRPPNARPPEPGGTMPRSATVSGPRGRS